MGSTEEPIGQNSGRMALLLLTVLSMAISAINSSEDITIPRHDLNTDTMITLAGYQAETHKVVTPDGYILTLYRIVGSGPVVYMQHGLEDSSAAWVLAGPDHGAPAFRLAEQGYDVWLGNYRGNHDSREHESLDPNHNEFWQFSWDEMAKYDLPTQLNFVITHTDSQKIYYVGHSMGTTTYMAMNSMDPTWGDKVELAVLLAPIAFVDHMQSPIKLIAPFSDLVQWVADHMGMGEFLPSNWLMDLIADFACGPNNPLEIICENVVFLLTGYDEKQMNKTMLPTIASHCPAGTSTYTVLQYAQEIKHKRFAGLDWGSDEKNIAHHGTPEPPVYDLRNVNTKVALFWGNNDWLCDERDLMKIVGQVPNIVVNNQVPWDGWNHLDFLYAIDIDQYQNDDLLAALAMYPIE